MFPILLSNNKKGWCECLTSVKSTPSSGVSRKNCSWGASPYFAPPNKVGLGLIITHTHTHLHSFLYLNELFLRRSRAKKIQNFKKFFEKYFFFLFLTQFLLPLRAAQGARAPAPTRYATDTKLRWGNFSPTPFCAFCPVDKGKLFWIKRGNCAWVA